MITPTVGRVVWFVPDAQDTIPRSDQVLAAIIAYVHSDALVNLAVIDCNGTMHPRTSVTLIQDGAKEGSYCTWMPFQKGQAAKTEALEQALHAPAPPPDHPPPAPQETTTQAPPIAPTDAGAASPAPPAPAIAPAATAATAAAPLPAEHHAVIDQAGVQQSPNSNG